MEPAPLASLQEEGEGEPGESPSSAAAAVPPRPATHHSLHKYAPLDWSAYFDEERRVAIPDTEDVFNVYMARSEGPVVFCLHGGGYSGWDFHINDIKQGVSLEPRPASRPICGASQLSFALAASRMKEKARVVSMDLRGHGKSTTSDDSDLSIETLSSDVIAVLRTLYGDSPPAIILVGHSMGGSVAIHVAAKKVIRNLHGLVVIDVVEIEWSVKGGPLRNIDSARVSIPSTLKYDESRECYTYRTPLEETEKYWKGWYEGLSEKFLSCPVQKVLLLAGTDRLDRALTIGQMQGKFQMVVVRHTGHAIQEDVPEEFASHILNFIARNKIGPNGVEIPGLIKKWQH
uniref:Protein phosphatase methylesterase 1 n=1 Tax=Oryza sativa subsp. japonica TaxID=39947 RepID=Q7XTH3_ORYSJ|nr:P0041A24.6 [Oryza sativa Japonica Group]